MEKEKFIEHVETMHLQNLSGREDFHKAFLIGIECAYDEFQEIKKNENGCKHDLYPINQLYEKCRKCNGIFE